MNIYLYIYFFIDNFCRYTYSGYLNAHQAASKLPFTVESKRNSTCSHNKQVQTLAKWYRQDISVPSVSDMIKSSGYTKPNGDTTSYCYVCITFPVTRLA